MKNLKINKWHIILLCVLLSQFNCLSQIDSVSKSQVNCVSNLNIDVDVLDGEIDIKDAENTITATNVIFEGGIAEYDAGNSITMSLGFNAKTGSEFKAYIEGCSPEDFVMKWQIDTPGTTVVIPTTGGGYSYGVDWGDGSFDPMVYTGDASHFYLSADTHLITISGNFPRIHFEGGVDSDKIVTVEQWGTQQWTSMEGAFSGCSNLVTIPSDPAPDLSIAGGISMRNMFLNCSSLLGFVEDWDTSNVIDMSGMFQNALVPEGIEFWDTGSVINMETMFFEATSFNQNIGNWITGSVTGMTAMFSGATLFNQDIGNWDINKLNNAIDMFSGVTLSTANYDALLIGWQSQSHNSNVIFSGGNSNYCSAQAVAARASLESEGWTITDAGVATGCIIECTALETPAHEAINVPIDAMLTWQPVITASGYKINIGTSSGATDVINEAESTGATSYTHGSNWLEDTTYYVTVIPYNEAGENLSCQETNFTTVLTAAIPECTVLENPANEAIDVPLNSSLTWQVATGATGYIINIGKSSGATDVLEESDLEDTTSYTHNSNWLGGTTYYVTIIPYNDAGKQTGCEETSFTTITSATIPNCTVLETPIDGAEGVSVNASLTWQEVASATGYNITIGLSSGGTEIENSDLGNVTSYTPNPAWSQNTTYYVTVIPYNEEGNAIACTETSFTTFEDIFIPNAFTPDNDGLNDTFNIINIDLIYPNYIILIYDRWGNNVYKGKNGWDGISQNDRSLGSKKVMQGTYYMLVVLNNSKTIKKTLLVEY